jgi:hypothetical protein
VGDHGSRLRADVHAARLSPEFTQAAYRVGDSVTNIISPMMSYFALIVAFIQRYDPRAGWDSRRDDAALLAAFLDRLDDPPRDLDSVRTAARPGLRYVPPVMRRSGTSASARVRISSVSSTRGSSIQIAGRDTSMTAMVLWLRHYQYSLSRKV